MGSCKRNTFINILIILREYFFRHGKGLGRGVRRRAHVAPMNAFALTEELGFPAEGMSLKLYSVSIRYCIFIVSGVGFEPA